MESLTFLNKDYNLAQCNFNPFRKQICRLESSILVQVFNYDYAFSFSSFAKIEVHLINFYEYKIAI